MQWIKAIFLSFSLDCLLVCNWFYRLQFRSSYASNLQTDLCSMSQSCVHCCLSYVGEFTLNTNTHSYLLNTAIMLHVYNWGSSFNTKPIWLCEICHLSYLCCIQLAIDCMFWSFVISGAPVKMKLFKMKPIPQWTSSYFWKEEKQLPVFVELHFIQH